MRKFINIHTHNKQTEGVVSVINLGDNYNRCLDFDPCSIGIHPWFVTDTSFKGQLDELANYAAHETVFAIGECGLDKRCETEWLLQQKAFFEQVKLANRIDKPLLIHCVKAFGEVVQCLQKVNSKVPVIFHGFNRGITVARTLIEKGYYLSFGRSLIRDQHLESLKACPLTQLFLETDDAELEIETVYNKASVVLGMPVEALAVQLHENYARVKKTKFNI
uniref:TatD-related deoxyribonuclease n=1 Tax=Sphingobacterium sp. (strain 21) TaxID=743722 RepID=F4C8C1_SPHS2